MLKTNDSLDNSLLTLFKASLSQRDKDRLDKELDSYAKELTSAMLFRTDYDELMQMLTENEISPLLFQWALAVRERMGDDKAELEV